MSNFQIRMSLFGSRMGLPMAALADLDDEDIGELDQAAEKRGDQFYARLSRLSVEMDATPPVQRLFRH